jgi:hypothetical protein
MIRFSYSNKDTKDEEGRESWRPEKPHVSLKKYHIVVRLPSPCRSQSRARHDLPTNSRLFSLGFDLTLFSSECESFCCFFRKIWTVFG